MSDTDTKNQGGRPTIYSDDLAATICQRMAGGESLRRICEDVDMPGQRTVFRWLFDGEHEEFWQQYARAREIQTETLFEEMFEIADNSADGAAGSDDDNVKVARDRVRVDIRKWAMSKLAPKKFGDKIEHTGDLTVRYEDTLKDLE